MRWCIRSWEKSGHRLFSFIRQKAGASKPGGLFRDYDEIGLDSGLIAEGIVRDDECGAYGQ
jgi:hypothetical protein